MYRDFESVDAPRLPPRPVEWQRRILEEGETRGSSAGLSPQELRSGLERWKFATGIAATPMFHQLVERWRAVHAPEIPTTLLVAFSKYESSGWNDATHGAAPTYTSPPFYELGVFQVPAGLHGRCTATKCEQVPPGAEKAGSPSAWSRICGRLRLDPAKWTDPTTQVRVGLSNLEDDAQIIRRRYPDLFPTPGTDWDLRGAVLLTFVGIGTANSLIKAYRQKLLQLPEADRWQFLSSHAVRQQPDARKASRMRDLLNNVDKKMRLHEALNAYFARNPDTPGPERASRSPVVATMAPKRALESGLASKLEPFVDNLAATWSTRAAGGPPAEKRKEALLKDHGDTVEGAKNRYGNKYAPEAISRAWMISREQQMKFETLSSRSLRSLRGLKPPAEGLQRVVTPLISGSSQEPVVTLMVSFIKELRRRHPRFDAWTYSKHGGGAFAGKGYSIDLGLDGRDDCGFHQPDAAVRFLRAVGDAAKAVNGEWRILYNDFSVANVINRESGVERVLFVGFVPSNKRNIIWHGPHPLILHFHLDLVPR